MTQPTSNQFLNVRIRQLVKFLTSSDPAAASRSSLPLWAFLCASAQRWSSSSLASSSPDDHRARKDDPLLEDDEEEALMTGPSSSASLRLLLPPARSPVRKTSAPGRRPTKPSSRASSRRETGPRRPHPRPRLVALAPLESSSSLRFSRSMAAATDGSRRVQTLLQGHGVSLFLAGHSAEFRA
jgi:hypothetical protein